MPMHHADERCGVHCPPKKSSAKPFLMMEELRAVSVARTSKLRSASSEGSGQRASNQARKPDR